MLLALIPVFISLSTTMVFQDHLTWAQEALQKSKEMLQKEGHVVWEKLGQDTNKKEGEGQEVQPSQPTSQTLEGFFQKKGCSGVTKRKDEEQHPLSPELTPETLKNNPNKESEESSCMYPDKDKGERSSEVILASGTEKGKRGCSGCNSIQGNSLDITSACGKEKSGKCPVGVQKPQNTEPQEDQTLVFVSFSMPETSLKSLLVEAEGKNVVLVIRGLIEDRFSKTAQKLKDLKGGMEINPELFEEYDIKAVPTFVQLKNREVKARLQGNVSLAYALETLKKEESA